MSEYARNVFKPILGDFAQFLPVRVNGLVYWWLNCIGLIDGLDRERTDADWSKVAGDWGSFEWISGTRRLEFKLDRILNAPKLFRIPEYPQGILFAKDELRSAVKQNGLTGFVFEPVWSSITGGVYYPAEIETSRMFDTPVKSDLIRQRDRVRDFLASRVLP